MLHSAPPVFPQWKHGRFCPWATSGGVLRRLSFDFTGDSAHDRIRESMLRLRMQRWGAALGLIGSPLWVLPVQAQSPTGSVEIVSIPASVMPGDFEDDRHIRVMLENRNARVTASIQVIRMTGTYVDPFPETETIEAETRVDSYLVHADLPDSSGLPGMSGGVVFDQEVVGIVCSGSALRASHDAGLNHPAATYPSPYLDAYGLEAGDAVMLAEFSVNFAFAVGDGVDQMRILTRVAGTTAMDAGTTAMDAGTTAMDAGPTEAGMSESGRPDAMPDDGVSGRPSRLAFRGGGGCSLSGRGDPLAFLPWSVVAAVGLALTMGRRRFS